MRFNTKNGKSEMRQIMLNGLKWNTGSNYLGRGEYQRYNLGLSCEIILVIGGQL